MPRYTAIFVKTVCNDVGRERKICQRVVEVHADSRAAALSSSKARFCALEQIPEWSLRADGIALQREPSSRGHTRSVRTRSDAA
jgi:hypothetical protein